MSDARTPRDEERRYAVDDRLVVPEQEVPLPDALPLLEALSHFDADFRRLSRLDMLRRYEAGWRHRGVVADPSEEELEFIRALKQRYGSTIDV